MGAWFGWSRELQARSARALHGIRIPKLHGKRLGVDGTGSDVRVRAEWKYLLAKEKPRCYYPCFVDSPENPSLILNQLHK
jgi:hypothetical protein